MVIGGKIEATAEAATQFFRAPWMDVIMDVPDAGFPEADVPEAATDAVAAPAGRVFAAWTC
jgi:hypothetical protein